MADTGAYFVPWARKYHPSHSKVRFIIPANILPQAEFIQAEDPAAMKETWDFCQAQVRKVTGK